ncbi:heavy metal translocating P-type ATPase [Paenibacillus sp. Marseille-Q4541]|uniref:heavy metal translocating P-type ATPase n=1 Tax=Paenibacillus sp. Marseille-Q4541 TaxID=2831522 RepID=UPI001BA4688B
MSTEAKQVKRELLLEGLDCANCAMKIEDGVKKVQGVTSASVNFATCKMILTAQEDMENDVIVEAKRKIKQLDSHIKVSVVGEKSGHGISADQLNHGSPPAQNKIKGGHHHHEHGHDHGHEHSDSDEHGHEGHTHDHSSGKLRGTLVRLGAGTLLAVMAVLLPVSGWAEITLFLLAYLLIGGDVLWQAVRNISRGQVFDEFFLMSIATIGAFAIQEFPEAVAVMLFYQIGEMFQSLAVNRSRKSIQSLMNIRPDYANLETEQGTRKVSPEEVEVGNFIIVKPGERVPLDGVVVTGTSMLDTSALTGESLPREAAPGSDMLSGFVNLNGVLKIEVTKSYGESTVSKILDLVQNASNKKAPTETFINKFARVYTPIVVIVAVLLAVVPPLVLSGAEFSDWLYRALIFLVISCPCALVVSIPLGFFGGIGAASKAGVLVKGGNYLEALSDVRTVVFDKTGTLTEGVFEVTGIYPARFASTADVTEEAAKQRVLEYTAYAELHSHHPIAESIRKAYQDTLREERVTDYEELSGHGIRAVVDNHVVLAGNTKLMDQQGVTYEEVVQYGTVIHLAIDGSYAGHIVISDRIKADAAHAIRELRSLSIRKTVMLTGDVRSVAESVAGELGVDEVHAELLPQHKVEQMERITASKGSKDKVMFVGDGINDTPVLAQADVGVAMGGLGSDAAIEAADIVIMTDEPSKIATAIRIAKRTRAIVWQNIIFALGVKGVFLLLGAFGIATMWEAVFSDVGVTVLAVLNSMRILKYKEPTATTAHSETV